MTAALADLLGTAQATWALGFAVFLRVGAAMAVLPAFGEQAVPLRVRLVLALAFTAVVAPAAAERLSPVAEGAAAARLLLTEPLAGLALGLILRLMVLALQVAGATAAQATSLSQIFGTAAVEPMPAIGHLMLVAGLALAAMLGLHLRLAEALILSYDALPPGRLPGAGLMASWGIAGVARAFALAFSLAAPFVIAATLYNLALGVINRAMPQLMVAFVGAPAITAGGLIIMVLAMPMLLAVWAEALFAVIADPFGPPG